MTISRLVITTPMLQNHANSRTNYHTSNVRRLYQFQNDCHHKNITTVCQFQDDLPHYQCYKNYKLPRPLATQNNANSDMIRLTTMLQNCVNSKTINHSSNVSKLCQLQSKKGGKDQE